MSKKGLLERLRHGGSVVVAEGYIFEFERRGYLKAGTFVPEVIIEHPELVRLLYEEFVHAGSDVVLAFTYYAHRQKLRLIGRESELETMNTTALKMAREIADKHGALMAGNICNTTAYIQDNPTSHEEVENIFKEQIQLAVKHGADFIVGETFGHYGEAKIALDSILKYGEGRIIFSGEVKTIFSDSTSLPAVVTLSAPITDKLIDGVTVVDACKKLEDGGAAVVGLNCGRGPATMIPLLKEIKHICKGPIAALPVTYRTSDAEPTFFSLKVPGRDIQAFPLDLTACLCCRTEIAEFARECKALGIEYIGLCCGNSANMTRIVAEIYEKNPAASKYSPDMSKHFIFGDKDKFDSHYTSELREYISVKQ